MSFLKTIIAAALAAAIIMALITGAIHLLFWMPKSLAQIGMFAVLTALIAIAIKATRPDDL